MSVFLYETQHWPEMSQAIKKLNMKNFKNFILREKCPITELFLVRIFLYSDWLQENTDQK